MLTTLEIEQTYNKAFSKVSKLACSSAKVFNGVYLVSDSNGRVWEVSRWDHLIGDKWMAQSYPVDHRSDYLDPMPTKKYVLESLGIK